MGVVVANVTQQYLQNAMPGKGVLSYDTGYRRGKHKNEIKIAEWLYKTFGGYLHVFDERGFHESSPDYLWNGKLWELKNPSTATATDNAVKKAAKQILCNPGGIILDYGAYTLSNEIKDVVRRRIERSWLDSVDVMFLRDGMQFQVLRYKK